MSLQRLGRDCATPRTWGGAVDGSKDTKKVVEEDVRQSCSNLIQEYQELCNQKKVRHRPVHLQHYTRLCRASG